MSSESEDEFQSADEGSDSDDLKSQEYRQNDLTQPLPSPDNGTSHEGVACGMIEEFLEGTKTEKNTHPEISESLEASISAMTIKDDSEGIINTEVLDKTESEESAKCNASNTVSDKGVSPLVCYAKPIRPSNDEVDGSSKLGDCESLSEIIKGSEDDTRKVKYGSIESSEQNPQIVRTEQKIYKKETNENLSEETKCINKNNEPRSEEINEKSEIGDMQLSVEVSSTVGIPATSMDEAEVLTSNSKSKTIRQSKIGMKKPREKLGERLGAKKLGSKIDKRNLSSNNSEDVMRPKNEEGDKMAERKTRSQIRYENKRLSEEEKTELIKKRQQWEEQQERWHQALNLDKERKEAGSGDGEGWGGSWGGWGSTLFSAASTFTREVGRGVGTVMETVESGIGAPAPEVMAQEMREQEQQLKNVEKNIPSQITEDKNEMKQCLSSVESDAADNKEEIHGNSSYGLGNFSLGYLVSGVSGALETAGSKVLLGGLDTLEVIGRKAMDVIQEGDPGLRKKRAFLSSKKPNLSQMLQEARQRAAEEERELADDDGKRNLRNSQKPSFDQAWEGTEGPIHLEALSLVAKQCQCKIVSLTDTLPHYIQDKLHGDNDLIKSTCELDEDAQVKGDLAEQAERIIPQTGLPLHSQKLCEAWSLVKEKATLIQEASTEETGHEQELYRTLAQLVAQFCALAHKGGELALITTDADPLALAVHFKELAQAVSGSLENTADQVCGAITAGTATANLEVNDIITNIYLQAASGNNYLQQSVILLASVLQYSNTKLAATHL